MQRYDYTALHRDFIDTADFEPRQSSSGPGSVASTISSASDHVNEEYKAKYERLQESYKRLQRNNISLEEKLLNVSEKFNADKNLLSRDLATQTQKVVEAKLTIQQLNKENFQLKSDLKVALQLLQNKPNAFVHQKLGNLPTDLQARVRDYYRDQEREKVARSSGQRISISVSSGGSNKDTDDAISAAILAKVLEQRERERSKDKKFCIDIGTQTHHWGFPDTVSVSEKQRGGKSTDEEDDLENDDTTVLASSSPRILPDEPSIHSSVLRKDVTLPDNAEDSAGDAVKSSSSKSQSWESDFDSECSYNVEHVSNLLLASAAQGEPGASSNLQKKVTSEDSNIMQQNKNFDEDLASSRAGQTASMNLYKNPAGSGRVYTEENVVAEQKNGEEGCVSASGYSNADYYSVGGLRGSLLETSQSNTLGLIKRSYTYDYLTSHQLESTPPYRAKPSIPSSSSVFQAFGAASSGQHVSIKESNIQRTDPLKQRTETMIQRIPENGQDLKVGAAGGGVDPGCVSVPSESMSAMSLSSSLSSKLSSTIVPPLPSSQSNLVHRTFKGLSTESVCSSREGSLAGHYPLSSSGRSTTTVLRSNSASSSRLTRSMSYSTKQTDI